MNVWASTGSVVVGTIILIVGVVLGWYVFPNIVDDQIAENVILYEDTDQYERFEELPIPLDFKVYIFNIKNPDAVNNGEKLIVEEKGPYVYKQSRLKTNITWSDNKRISYYEYLKFDFDQQQSGALKETDVVTVLNPALNGAIQILELTGLNFLLPILSATAEITFGAKNIFLKSTVGEFLFDGYKICDIDKINAIPGDTPDIKKYKLLAKIACLGLFVMPTKNIKPVRNIIDKDTDKKERLLVFTFLAHKKDNHDGRYTINSGMNDVQEVGEIEKWEGKSYLESWAGGSNSSCNQVRGRDAVIFPPHINSEDTLTVFNTDICRTVDLRYTKYEDFRDVEAIMFILDDNTLRAPDEEKEDEMCYCLKVSKGITETNGCMKKGLLEIFTCYNAPILLSFPHFLWADNEYKDSVEGLSPDVDKHMTFALLEPNTGTPLSGAKRVQFNMFVRDIKDTNGDSVIDFLKGYQNAKLIPILWLSEGFTINDELYDVLYDQYISKTYLVTAVTWAVIGLGIAVVIITLIVVLVLQARSKRPKETV